MYYIVSRVNDTASVRYLYGFVFMQDAPNRFSHNTKIALYCTTQTDIGDETIKLLGARRKKHLNFVDCQEDIL